MEDPLLQNIPVAPLAAPVPIEPVAFNPVVPAPTTNLLQEAYARLMAPTNTGTIAQRPAWAQARIDQAQSAGGGQIAQGGGGGGGVAYPDSNVPGQRMNVEGTRKGAEGTGMTDAGTRRMDIEGMKKDVEGTRVLPNLGVLPNQGVLPNLGAYKYDRQGRRIK